MLVLFIWTIPGEAFDYYISLTGSDTAFNCVDSRNRIDRPKRNFHGANGAIACLVAGDRLYVRGGNWGPNDYINGQSSPILKSGTSWTNAITIEGYPGETAVLKPGTAVTTVVNIPSQSYIIVKNLRLDATNAAHGTDCSSGTCQSYGTAISMGSPGGGHHIRIENCDVGPAFSTVMFLTNDSEVINSKLHDSTRSYGIYAPCARCIIDGNEFYNNHGHGIQLYSASDKTPTHDSIIRNNIVYNNGSTERGIPAITVGTGDRIKIYNNLVYNHAYSGGIYIGTNTPVKDVEVYNNTIYNNNGSGIKLGDRSTGAKLYNNISYNNSVSIENSGSAGATTGTNLCQHAQFGCTIVANPLFVNPTATPPNLQLQSGSPAKDAGTTLALVTTDFAGPPNYTSVPRPQPQTAAGKYDIGAYEIVQATGPVANTNPIYVAKTGSDSNNCFAAESQSTPKLTIGSALSCMTVAGKKLYIKAGTYVEALNSPITGGASWNAPTVISAFDTDVVMIQPASGSAVLTLNGTSTNIYKYTSFEKLIFDATNTDAGIVQGPAAFVSFIRYLNGQVRNAAVGSGISGLHAGSELVGMYVHHNATNGLAFCGQGVTIRDSEMSFNGSYGIQLYDPGTPGCATNTAIFKNRIHDNQSNGGVLLGGGDNVQFYNNLVYGNVGGGIKPVRYGPPTNVKIYNNTIYNNTADGIIVAGDATGTELVNNILYLNPVAITDSGVGTIMTTNLCGAPGVGCEKVGDPLFVNAGAGNFQLQALSPARNAGTTKTLVATDFAGVARPQPPSPTGKYDIGAHEFVEEIPPEEGNTNTIYVAKTGTDSTATGHCIVAESESTPKLTIANALLCMTVPGKKLMIKTGTYVENIETKTQPITGGNGPSYTDATTIQAFGSDIVTIQLPAGGAAGIALFLNNSDHHLLFKNLIFDSANKASSNVIALMPGTHHIRFEGCEGKNTLTGFEVVFINQANNIEFVHSTFHHSATDAIFLKGPLDGFLCEYCTIHSAGDAGISWNSTGVKTNIVLRETVVNGNTAEGIDAATSTGALIQNALVYANGGIGVRMRTGANNLKLYNSSVHGNTGVGVQCDAGSTGVEIKNVISYANATNIVNNCGATTATNYTTDPLFINPGAGNFRLSNGSGAINTGTPLPGLTIDLDGAVRPQGTYDIGAYERDQLTPPTQDVIALRRAFWQMELLY
jgi:hypothetical protein